LKYYRDFASENSGDPWVKRQAAQAGQRLGDIQQRLGDYDQARKTYDEALERFEQLVAEYPDVWGYRKDLAGCTNSVGILLAATGRPREAAETFRRAIGHFELPASMALAGSREGLATAYVNLAMLLTEIGGEPGRHEAEKWCRQALDLHKQMADDNP